MMVLEFGSKGYSCAQIILAAGLRLMGRENPDLVRTMSGLAQGVGGSGNICGALVGGVCLIGLHTGKGLDDEEPFAAAPLLLAELTDWFQAGLCGGGAITCDAMLESVGLEAAHAARSPHCAGLVAAVWEKTIAILRKNGFDPSLGRAES